MAKRYHQSNKRLGPEFYAGYDPRRRQEMEDGEMLHEDHSAMANLPQQVIMREYPKAGGYLPEDLEDNIREVDGQMNRDHSQMMKHFKPKKTS